MAINYDFVADLVAGRKPHPKLAQDSKMDQPVSIPPTPTKISTYVRSDNKIFDFDADIIAGRIPHPRTAAATHEAGMKAERQLAAAYRAARYEGPGG